MANAFGCYPKVPGSNPGPRASVVRGVKMPPMSTMVYAPGTLWVTKVETLEDGTQAVTAVDLSGTIELKFKFDQRASLEEAVPHPGQHIRLSEFSYSKLENAREAHLEGRGEAVLDINAVGGPKHTKEAMCVAQTAVLGFYGKEYGSWYVDVFQKIADVCDEHRPIGSNGKHGTRRCTYTCGCDKN